MCSQRVINPQPSLLICRLRSSRASALPSPGCSRAPGRNLPDGPLPSKLWCPRECSRGPVQSIKRISSFFCLLYWVTVFSLELIFIVSDHRHVRGIAVTFAPPPNFTAEAATAQRGLSRPQRGKRWLHWGGDPGLLTPRHVLLWPLRLRAASLGSVLPRRRVSTLLVPQPDLVNNGTLLVLTTISTAALLVSEDGKDQVLYSTGYSEAAKKHE